MDKTREKEEMLPAEKQQILAKKKHNGSLLLSLLSNDLSQYLPRNQN